MLTQSSSADTILQALPFEKSKKRKRATQEATPALTSGLDGQNVSLPKDLDQATSPAQAGQAEPETAPVGGREPERVDAGATGGHEPAKGTSSKEEVKVASHHDRSVHIDGPDPEPVPTIYTFYLLMPRTSSTRLVLIPLDPTATLAKCLRGRTVLEFPTIHVFRQTSSLSPDRFMLEAEYLQQESEEQKEFDELLKQVSPETLRALKEERGEDSAAAEHIDNDRLLDVLKQDLGA